MFEAISSCIMNQNMKIVEEELVYELYFKSEKMNNEMCKTYSLPFTFWVFIIVSLI